MHNLKPLKLLPVRERVAAALRKAILTKEFKEHDIITLEQISKQLGISTTPVREAFQLLDKDGLIQLRPNKGALVLGINEKIIHDHYETRAILESECAYKVCLNKYDISEIKSCFDQAENALKVKNFSDYTDYNQAFHMAIWNTAGNDKITSILSSMWNGLSLGYQVTEETYASISMSEHKNLMKAILEYDAEKSKKLMFSHIMRSMENMLTNLF
jgi:DNA-binding GntR family transcriptional regulator